MVTYDDTYSLGDKAAYAKSSGMGGVFTWSLDQVCDHNTINAWQLTGELLVRTMAIPCRMPFGPVSASNLVFPRRM